ncbi:MAG: winged helix-turn-helix domain-containing protein [Sediminispirochaetaceae bacterium]
MPSGSGAGDFSLKTKIYLTDADGAQFMGIGVLWLMQHIDACGSIRKAAAEMHLSYAKAHRMIRDVEGATGLQLVERRKGGTQREGTSLTPTGRKFIEIYQRFQNEVKENAEDSFRWFRRELGDLY